MKVVIDIPETYYELCRVCAGINSATADQQIIAQGTPYEERPHGEKIKKKPYGWVYCSECDSLLEPQDKFCWNCGADMRGKEE